MALRGRPDHFWARCLQAICFIQTKNFDAAKSNLVGCLQAEPDSAWLYLLRGFACGQLGTRDLNLVKDESGPRVEPEKRRGIRVRQSRGRFSSRRRAAQTRPRQRPPVHPPGQPRFGSIPAWPSRSSRGRLPARPLPSRKTRMPTPTSLLSTKSKARRTRPSRSSAGPSRSSRTGHRFIADEPNCCRIAPIRRRQHRAGGARRFQVGDPERERMTNPFWPSTIPTAANSSIVDERFNDALEESAARPGRRLRLCRRSGPADSGLAQIEALR